MPTDPAKIRRVFGAGARSVGGSFSGAAGRVSSPTPTASDLTDPWSSYWTFVTASLVIAFLLYTAQKGTLGTWIGFLSWTTPQPIASATPTTPGQAIAQTATTGAAAQAGNLITGNFGTAIWNAIIGAPLKLFNTINPFLPKQ